LVSDEELERRKASWKRPVPLVERGYVGLYIKHVEQANLGADLDFLKGSSGSEVSKDSH
jgi:L-arabonate dehydrase